MAWAFPGLLAVLSNRPLQLGTGCAGTRALALANVYHTEPLSWRGATGMHVSDACACVLLCADPVYPPSLYRAVSYASTLGVPVYILENGMPSKEVRLRGLYEGLGF